MTHSYYAHSKQTVPPEEWHLLKEHLQSVAEKASDFASAISAGKWAYWAGLWHDIGKYSEEFQNMLFAANGIDAHIEKPGRVDHSTAGAQLAVRLVADKGRGKLIAYMIAGHHAGLPNGDDNQDSCLEARLKKKIPDFSQGLSEINSSIGPLEFPFNLSRVISNRDRFAFQISFFVRMIFSALVDSDFLDTERFMEKERSSQRQGYPTLEIMSQRLETHMAKLSKGGPEGSMNRIRSDVLEHCRAAAGSAPGLFSLTVPTGGGKTLSSLSFAARHALKYGKGRIIYVIPYTSIIEQNAAVFREALGADSVLEHHSNFEPKEEDYRSRLASENWDASLVVTTNVQFFESLFASRPSACRKLHNIANSVVILDEAQMLPVELLNPCLEAIRELADVYKATVVLCTATQPALSTTETFKNGLDGVREIIPEPEKLYNSLKRVEIKNVTTTPDDDLIEQIASYEKVLCIVNTRAHARTLFEKLKGRVSNEQNSFHLSALMCPAHRTQKFEEVRKALLDQKTCRVISTQLVEAGVDIDFPVVFRAVSGIDSIAQAAGRCNREGKLEKGKVFVFGSEKGLPPGYFRQAAQTAESVLRRHEDILSVGAVKDYFQELYWIKGNEALDEFKILPSLGEDAAKGNFPFRDVAGKFKMIRDGTMSVIIPWDEEAEGIIQRLRFSDYPSTIARRLQRYAVQIYPQTLAELMPALECIRDQYYVLRNMEIYRDDVGLCPEDPSFHKIENLIC